MERFNQITETAERKDLLKQFNADEDILELVCMILLLVFGEFHVLWGLVTLAYGKYYMKIYYILIMFSVYTIQFLQETVYAKRVQFSEWILGTRDN